MPPPVPAGCPSDTAAASPPVATPARPRPFQVRGEVPVLLQTSARRARIAATAFRAAPGSSCSGDSQLHALGGRDRLDAQDRRTGWSVIGSSRRAPWQAIETWSSWLADVGVESTEAGWAICRFSRHQRRRRHLGDHQAPSSAPAAGPGTRAGRSSAPGRPAARSAAGRSTRSRTRPARPGRRRRRPARRGSCRRTPRPRRPRPAGCRSRRSPRPPASARPTGAGPGRPPRPGLWQRMQYGSCTRSSPATWLARMADPSSSARSAAAASICPRWPRRRVDVRDAAAPTTPSPRRSTAPR